MDPDPDPGGSKTCGSGSATLLFSLDRYLSQSRGLSPSFTLASWLSQFRGLNSSCLLAPYRGLFLPSYWFPTWASSGLSSFLLIGSLHEPVQRVDSPLFHWLLCLPELAHGVASLLINSSLLELVQRLPLSFSLAAYLSQSWGCLLPAHLLLTWASPGGWLPSFSLAAYMSQSRGLTPLFFIGCLPEPVQWLPPSLLLAFYLSQSTGLSPSLSLAFYLSQSSGCLLPYHWLFTWASPRGWLLPYQWLLTWANPGGCLPPSQWLVPGRTVLQN